MTSKNKRFYTRVDVKSCKNGFMVQLDDRPIKSPGRRMLECPSVEFAQSLALEWRAQEEFIDQSNMPIMYFASFVTDTIIPSPNEARAEILKYGHSDLLCYRASEPMALSERQSSLWDLILQRFKSEVEISFAITTGIQYVDQGVEDMQRLCALIAPLEGYQLGAVQLVTSMTGSAILAIALYKNWLTTDAVWELSHIDEDFQIEQWGSDHDEEQRRQRRYKDFCAACSVFSV